MRISRVIGSALITCGSFFFIGRLSAATETKTDNDLRGLVARQRVLLERASEADDQTEIDDVRPQIQTLVFDYERFLRENPQYVPGYVSFAMLLSQDIVDERRRAVALLLKANALEPNLPLVKNQIGNYLAEEGKPLEAINYYLAAADLEPREPLYHYQIGLLLTLARDDFRQSGEWTDSAIATTAHSALGQAFELEADNFEFGYRFAQSFYELPTPDWGGALKVWHALEALAATDLAKQTVQLQRANVLLKAGDYSAAKSLMDGVTMGDLQPTRFELLLSWERAAAVPGN